MVGTMVVVVVVVAWRMVRGGFVRRTHGFYASGAQRFLNVTHVCVAGGLVAVLVPAWIKGQRVVLKHALEQADDMVAVS